MALELIKISEFPESADPKDWIVVSDSTGAGYKLSKDNLKAFLGTVTVTSPKPINPTDPAPTLDGVYIPEIDGTYTNLGGIIVDRSESGVDYGKSVTILKNGSSFVKVSEPLPQAENKIDNWVAGTYVGGSNPDQVIHQGQIWSVKPEIASTTQEPGTGDDWVGDLDFVQPDQVAPTIDKTDQAFNFSGVPIPTSPEKSTGDLSTTGYGSAAGNYGWGFPVGVRKSFSKVFIRLYNPNLNIVTQYRIVVKENDYNGTVLSDKTYSDVSLSDSTVIINSEFPLIENVDGKRLWVEYYTNVVTGVYVTGLTPQIYTEASGYPKIAYNINNDMGSGGFSTIAAMWLDIEAIFEGHKFEIEATDRLKEIITEEAEKVPLPQDVTDATIKTNSLFQYGYVQGEDFTIFNDSVGPYGGTFYALGFPIGELSPFKNITVAIYKNSSLSPLATEITAILHEVNKDGEEIATSLPATIPSGITGRYDIDFQFDNIINHQGRIYIELRSQGVFGAYRRYPNTDIIFTQSNGYPPHAYNTTLGGALVNRPQYYDFWFKTDTYEEKMVFTPQGEELFINEEISTFELPNENWFISFIISSVTWGDGFLQSGYVKEFIKWLQSVVAKSFTASQITKGTPLSNRKYFLGEAVRLEGIGEEIEFNITGNEVSIIQAIDRSNINASEIEVYIDGNLYDTFNNFNEAPVGNENKVFIGDGTAALFDLNKPFTYGHVVTLNGSPQVVTHNTNASTGFTIPAGSDCGIIRKLGQDENGNPAVTHWVWFKNTPSPGDEISVTYDYGANLFYEKTTIGETANGIVECPYGEGDISFDPTQPSSIGAGLDFRQTDERVVKTYRFLEEKTRNVRVRIKGLYGSATGTPYFIFNFATNRYFNFQNAGIGGWDLWDFDKNIDIEPLRGFQNVLAFNPDILIAEGTPNDDWHTAGHKLYNTINLTLSQLRSVKTFPLRSIAYQSGTDTYDVSKWRGHITAITKTSVTFSGDVSSPIVAGDYVIIGQYWSNNFDYIERLISSIDGNTIYFDKPISDTEVIYDSIDDFVGKEIGVRSYDIYKNKLQAVLDKLHTSSDMKIHLLENPMPNLLARELWGYPILNDKMANANPNTFSVIYNSLREWQYSQPKTSIQVNISGAVLDSYINKNVIEFGSNGQNLLATDILLNGESIYGTRAVVESGWAYVVDQSKTGVALNKSVAATTATNQVFNGRKPRVVILDETLTSGTLTVKYATSLWSNDSCHMNSNSSKLYADFLMDAML